MRMIAKLAMYALGLLAIVNVARSRRRQLDRNAGKEALMTWEDEGGSVPAGPGHEHAGRAHPSTM
jgi:hypothetical protein